MKRTTIFILVILICGMLSSKSVNAADNAYFEVIKGEVVDFDDDGKWDELSFVVKTKNAKINVPVLSVRIIDEKTGDLIPVSFSGAQISRRIDEFHVDLSGLKLQGDFVVEIELDTSQIYSSKDEQVVDGGPGPIPKPTILKINYP